MDPSANVNKGNSELLSKEFGFYVNAFGFATPDIDSKKSQPTQTEDPNFNNNNVLWRRSVPLMQDDTSSTRKKVHLVFLFKPKSYSF